MRHLRAVLFDLDGTLLDSIPGILRSFAEVHRQFPPPRTWTTAEMIRLIGIPIEEQMLIFSEGDTERSAQMARLYREFNGRLLPSMRLFEGALGALRDIRAAGLRTGLVTSKGRPATEVSLRACALEPYLDLVLTASETPTHKPHPGPLLMAAEKLGLEPAQMAYVGDSVHDIRCANAAGAVSVAALWGPFEVSDLEEAGPAHRAASLGVLTAMILKDRG